MFKHALGVEVVTKVSELRGIITSRSECLFGCNRYFVQPKADKKDMKMAEGWWVDEEDIEVKGRGVNAPRKITGGPMSRSH